MTAPAVRRAYLRRFYWRRVVPTIFVSGLVNGFCLADLYRFSVDGDSLLHPFLAVFFSLACTGLGIVALLSAWEISRYVSLWGFDA